MSTVQVYSSFSTKDGKRITVRQKMAGTRAVDLLKRLLTPKRKAPRKGA